MFAIFDAFMGKKVSVHYNVTVASGEVFPCADSGTLVKSPHGYMFDCGRTIIYVTAYNVAKVEFIPGQNEHIVFVLDGRETVIEPQF